MGNHPNWFEATSSDARFDFVYPEIYDPAKRHHLTVGLTHTRAADDIRISYDSTRDGWIIEQASRFEWDDGEETDPDWQEVAFIKAWARDKRNKP